MNTCTVHERATGHSFHDQILSMVCVFIIGITVFSLHSFPILDAFVFLQLCLSELTAKCEHLIGTEGGGMDQAISLMANHGMVCYLLSFSSQISLRPCWIFFSQCRIILYTYNITIFNFCLIIYGSVCLCCFLSHFFVYDDMFVYSIYFVQRFIYYANLFSYVICLLC